LSDPSGQPSKLLLDECFVAEDVRFLETLRQFQSYHFLLAFVQRWVADPRPWAREQIIRYVHSDLNTPGHEVIVKRLFKHFEATADHEMMGHFLVSFDRSVRRIRTTAWHFNQISGRAASAGEILFARPNRTVRERPGRVETVKTFGFEHQVAIPAFRNRPENRLFTHRTRNYLRRRVWRYFRQLSYRKPAAYVAAISGALCEFEDADFAAGENILDNWSLMHACYFEHDAIAFGRAHTNLREGRSLAELTPAPYQPRAWTSDKGAIGLLHLVAEAKSSLVRLWALELLRREHRRFVATIDVETLLKLLGHADPRVQEFAAELFQTHSALAVLGLDTWLELLEQSSQAVLPRLCDAMRKYVSPDRLDNRQMIALTCARPVPVARLGFEMIQRRHASRPFHRDDVARLADVRCVQVASEVAAWAFAEIGPAARYEVDCVIEFFDALVVEVRTVALDWLVDPESAGFGDPVLWARLVETPFDDVRFRLIDCLERRAALPGRTTDDLSPLWVTVILGVHRGGRAKGKAIRQIAAAISNDLSQADRLLPVIGVALRSVRAPERRSALAALASLLSRHDPLREQMLLAIPELQWPDALEVG